MTIEVREESVSPIWDPTTPLDQRIKLGNLYMRADEKVLFNFGFLADEQPIGLFAAVSTRPGTIALCRAWNASNYTRCPIRGIQMPCSGRQLHAIANRTTRNPPVLFLLEFGKEWQLTGKVAFKARKAVARDVEIPGMTDKKLLFEELILSEIDFLG